MTERPPIEARRARRLCRAVAFALVACLCLAPAAGAARKSIKKSMWGPAQVNGVSQFPIYQDLGVGLYQIQLHWGSVATRRPTNPTDPADPAYAWPAELDYAVSEAGRYGIEVSIQIITTPSWANGGRSWNWAPNDPRDFANFAAAASRRYPSVRHWMVWGEPSRHENFQPLQGDRRRRPTAYGRRGIRRYAQMLDASYASLKGVNPRNRVIGGNTFTSGDVSPRNFMRAMRLRNGRPPRMDMYGHNPFSYRKPNLRRPLFQRKLGYGMADFSDLDTLARWLDRYLGRRGRNRRLRIFISEYFQPTDHRNHEFNWWVSRRTQASHLRAALRITRRWSRIYTLGWLALYDDPPNGPNGRHKDDVHRGLLDWRGNRKPSYYVYRKG